MALLMALGAVATPANRINPGETYGEEIMAAVVVKPGQSLTEDEVKRRISGYVTKFKTPAQVFFLETLPKNPSGKILKRALREQFTPRRD
jgi:fatty-acyl-CoA synthase